VCLGLFAETLCEVKPRAGHCLGGLQSQCQGGIISFDFFFCLYSIEGRDRFLGGPRAIESKKEDVYLYFCKTRHRRICLFLGFLIFDSISVV
jgi:hypothetical protein